MRNIVPYLAGSCRRGPAVVSAGWAWIFTGEPWVRQMSVDE